MLRKFLQMARAKSAVAAAFLQTVAILAIIGSAGALAASKVEFKIVLGDGPNRVENGGRLHLENGGFRYSADNLTLTGKVDGDSLTVDGVFVTVKPPATRKFTLTGKFVAGHFAATVMADDGKRLGSLSLDLKDD